MSIKRLSKVNRKLNPPNLDFTCKSIAEEDFKTVLKSFLLPETRNSIALSSALSPRERPKMQIKPGVWNFRTTNVTDPAFGWLVIHWPTVFQNFVTREGTLDILESLGYAHPEYLAEQFNPEYFSDNWERLKRAFENSLPPGCKQWSLNSEFKKLLTYVPKTPDLESSTTVIRTGAFVNLNSTNSGIAIDFYKRFKRSLNISENIRDYLPDLLQLFLDALDHATEYGGYTDWGLMWTKLGVVFNYGCALSNAKTTKHLSHKYRDDFHTLVGEWKDPHYYLRSLKLWPTNHKNFNSLTRAHNGDHVALLHNTYRCVEGVTLTDVHRNILYNPQFTVSFPINGAEHGLVSYLEYLNKLTNDSDQLNALLRKRHKIIKRRTKKKEQKHLVPSEIKISAINLGYEPESLDDFAVLTMRTVPWCKKLYFAFPEELISLYPELRNTDAYVKYRGLPNKFLDMTSRATSEDQNTHVNSADRTYLHPDVLSPAGEALDFLKAVHETSSDKEVYPLASKYVEAFTNFIYWLYKPKHALLDGVLGGEFEFLVDETRNPLFPLSTYDARIEYLLTKANQMAYKPLAYMEPAGIKGARSARLTKFDNFVLWYVATQELPKLSIELNNLQQSEYIALRWLRWRYKHSLVPHLISPNYGYLDPRLPLAKHDTNMKDILAEAKEKFGPSFTELG